MSAETIKSYDQHQRKRPRVARLGQGQPGGFVGITVASPEAIRSWSKGEVKNPETINYRTFKPEKGGLFCERIFGPVKDWECSCGKYKRIKHRGVVCDRCGVEVTLARVRRERMGHIELAVPVSHIWFFKCMPSRIGLVLDMTARHLERVIYYEDYLVIDPGNDAAQARTSCSAKVEFREAKETYGADAFVAKMGAEAVREALAAWTWPSRSSNLQVAMTETKSKQIRKKLAKRIKLLQGLHLVQEPSRMDDPHGAAGDSAGPAPAGAARRWTLCDVRLERSCIAASSTGTTG